MSKDRVGLEIRRPLSPAILHILLALSDGRRHGYAIKQEAEARSDGAVRLGPGTLYETIQRLLDARLIREASSAPDPANGQEAQRRYYELSPQGRRVLQEEVARLARLLDYARSKPKLA
jgi:DNA-binding PadR family transcriptional regulator